MMAPLEASHLTEGLKTKLFSSLPLEARCRLATNGFTCRVVIPHKEVVVLDWIFSSLDLKYRDRLPSAHLVEEVHLWQCLTTCLQNLPSSLHYDFSTVPEFLLNIIPQADLSLPYLSTCISLLLPLGSTASPSSPSWSSVLSSLLRHDDLLPDALSTLSSLPLQETTKDPAPLLTSLSRVLLSHPEYKAQITAVASSLLFHKAEEYIPLLTHLSTEEQSEEKYQPTSQAAILLSCLEAGTDPRLLMAAASSQESSLRLPLLSLCSFLCSGPSSICGQTTMAAMLQAVTVSDLARIQGVFTSSLPLDLSLDLRAGLGCGRYLQDLVRHCLDRGGAGRELTAMVSALHTHHPHLLEPLVPDILVRYLEQGTTPEPSIFHNLLDVMLKLRQVPKMVARLFNHIRSMEQSPCLSWQPGDMDRISMVLPSLPRVQTLEIWKTLNYHFTSECLVNDASIKVSSTCSLLAPLLSSLLNHSQLADHNLPSSLLPRITDLVQTTEHNLTVVLEFGFLPTEHRNLLLLVTSALADLVMLFSNYRDLQMFHSVTKFQLRVAAWILENPEWMKTPAAKRLMQNYYQPSIVSTKEKAAVYEAAILEEHISPHVIEDLPETCLLKLVRNSGVVLPACLLEQSKCCALIILSLLERVNRGSENLYIPSPEVWTRPDGWTDLDSYLSKSLSSTIVTFIHSEVPASSLEQEDLQRLEDLPLEYLPSVLKLGATLLALTQVLRGREKVSQYRVVASRCLETTDMFRYVDAGFFLNKVLALEGDKADLVEVVTKNIGKFTKTILDVEASFHYFEESIGQQFGDDYLRAAVGILSSLSKTLTEGMEGSDKKVAGKQLADKIAKFIQKMFKKRNVDNSDQMNVLLEAAAELVVIFAPRGLGKMAKMINKLVDLAFTSTLPAWKQLLAAICHNLNHLDLCVLPEDWRLQAWSRLSTSYTEDCKPLVESMLGSCNTQEMELLLQSQETMPHLGMWTDIVLCHVDDTCIVSKNAGVKRATVIILQQARDKEFDQLLLLPRFLESLFSSSPPCLSPQLETLCLGCLVFAPLSSVTETLSALASFLSHRSSLSTRVIPLVTSLLRHLLPSLTTVPSILGLQSVLGLFSRHKTDWAAVTPALLADLLHVLPTLSPQCRAALTTAVLPLVASLDKHNMEHLAAHLPPATNEVFKQVLLNYNANHKFRGKV